MFCTYCGAENPDNSTFCIKCGNRIKMESALTPPGSEDEKQEAAVNQIQPAPTPVVGLPKQSQVQPAPTPVVGLPKQSQVQPAPTPVAGPME